MMYVAIDFQLAESISHTDHNLLLNVQTVMSRKYSFNLQYRNLFKRREKCLQVGGRVVRKQRVLIDKIAGK